MVFYNALLKLLLLLGKYPTADVATVIQNVVHYFTHLRTLDNGPALSAWLTKIGTHRKLGSAGVLS